MKKIIPIGVLIVLLLIIGAYFILSNKSSKPIVKTQENTLVQPTVGTAKSSLLDLLSQGKNLKCTYSNTVDKTESSGTFYLSGKKVRGDFTTLVEGKTSTGSMIRDDNFTYIWGMNMPQGIKMKNTTEQSPNSTSQTNQYYNPEAKIDYNCGDWSPDSSLFTPPVNVTFTEFSVPQVTGTSSGTSPNNQEACGACNSLSGQAKTACLTQLNCQ